MPKVDGRLRLIKYEGETLSLTQWAKRYGLRVDTLFRRLNVYRMPLSKALSPPRIKKLRFRGKEKTVREWSSLLGIPRERIDKRLNSYGMSPERALSLGSYSVTHGMSKRPGFNRRFYRKWTSMMSRCREHPRYKGKVKVSRRWQKFENFHEDMLASYLKTGAEKFKIYLDRIDNNKGYSKENCRWVSAKESALNRSSTRWLAYGGERKSMTDWAFTLGITPQTLWQRLKKMSVKDALSSDRLAFGKAFTKKISGK